MGIKCHNCEECKVRKDCNENFDEMRDAFFQKALDCGPDAWQNGIRITIASKIPEESLSIVTGFCKTYGIDIVLFLETFYSDILYYGLELKSQELHKEKDPEETLKLARDRIAQMKHSSRKARK